MNRYSTPLLKSSGPGRSIQVSSLNSFWGWNSSLSSRLKPKIRMTTRDRDHVDGEDREEDLAALAHLEPPAACRIERHGEVDGEGNGDDDGGGQPVLAVAGEADGEDGAADDPGAPERAAEVEADLAGARRGALGLALEQRRPPRAARSRRRRRPRSRAAAARERDERQRRDHEHDVEVAQEGQGLRRRACEGSVGHRRGQARHPTAVERNDGRWKRDGWGTLYPVSTGSVRAT